jgi:hypothetical protein
MIELEEQTAEPSIEKHPAHYVDNKKFFEALIEYKKQVDEAKEKGLEKPRVSNYIGECFLKIATHLSYKGNFINYTFKDDMISDGIENCLTAVEKFDPLRSTNPFAYYTQIIYFAFIRRIQKEKKQQVTKYKMLENIDIEQLVAHSEDNEELVNHLMELARKQMDTVDPDRRNIKPGRPGRKKTKIEPGPVANFE